jgi:uncharacterized protein (DUF1810 family)
VFKQTDGEHTDYEHYCKSLGYSQIYINPDGDDNQFYACGTKDMLGTRLKECKRTVISGHSVRVVEIVSGKPKKDKPNSLHLRTNCI